MKGRKKKPSFVLSIEIETDHSVLSTSSEGVLFQEIERWTRSRCGERQIKVTDINWKEK